MNSVGSYYQTGVAAYQKSKATTAYSTTSANGKESDAKTEASDQNKQDVFEKSPSYKPDLEKINAMKADLSKNISSFRQMIKGMIVDQGGFVANSAMNQLLEIDEAAQLKAQQAISEDGEWGVTAVSDRILDFAKALSGEDPAKIDALQAAFEQGFALAEKAWGGKLPEISYQTRKKVMDGFKEWNASAEAPAVPENSDDSAVGAS